MGLVDIVIPAHNAARYVEATLESVRRQTMPRWRAWVVDDASTDGTADRILASAAAEPRISFIASEQNLGAARARDLALGEGDAPYAIFMDSDDTWEPDALEVLLDALEAAPGAPAAHGFGRNMDEQGRALVDARGSDIVGLERPVIDARGWRRLAPHEPTPFEAFAVSCPIPTPGMVLVRRAALDALGPLLWDQMAFPADDWLLWLRLTEGGTPFAFLPRPVLRYRRHAAQATSRANPHMGEADAYVRRWLASRAATPERRRLVQEGVRYEWRRTAALRARWAAKDATRGRAMAALRQGRHAAMALRRSLPAPAWVPASAARHAPG